MLRFEQHIDLRDDINPEILKLSDWDPSMYQDTIYDYPLTKGEYDRMVEECEAEILYEGLEAMFGITPETFNMNELIKTTFFKKLDPSVREHYINVIDGIFEKYKTIEDTYELFQHYDNDSFDVDYDNDPVPEDPDDCEFFSSGSDNDDDDDDDE